MYHLYLALTFLAVTAIGFVSLVALDRVLEYSSRFVLIANIRTHGARLSFGMPWRKMPAVTSAIGLAR
jgi:hypothetical protein